MQGINSVILVGRVMSKPAATESQTGQTIVTLLVGTQHRDRQLTHRCILFGKAADFVVDHVATGQLVGVTGRLDYRPYIRDNVEHVSAEIYVISVQLLQSDEVPSERNTERLRGNQL